MTFSLVEVEVGRFGNTETQRVVQSGFGCCDDAVRHAAQLAQAVEKHGYNDDNGYWWFHRGQKLYRLLVRATAPAPAAALDPLHAWVASGFLGVATSVLRQPDRSPANGRDH